MSDLRQEFTAQQPRLLSVSDAAALTNSPWSPVLLTREQIDAEIERLASLPRPEDGLRASFIAHPNAPANAPGLTPGIQVMLCVLKPGERTAPFRHNATEVNFCIRGRGTAQVAGRTIPFGQYDVWNTPSHNIYSRTNDGDDLQACLTYSNVPLLRLMQVYLPDPHPQSFRLTLPPATTQPKTRAKRARSARFKSAPTVHS